MAAARGREVAGRVSEILPNAMYRVDLDEGGRVLCHVAGAARRHLVHLLVGERVSVVVSPFDATRGRIIGRTR